MGVGLVNHGAGYGAAGLLVLGVFLGSALWWLILSLGVGLILGRYMEKALIWVNRVSGLVLLGFGVAILLSLKA